MQYVRIEHLRVDNDYTQQYIADYLGIRREVYRRYEKGYRSIPVDLLIKLSDLYDTSIDYIVGNTNIKRAYKKPPTKPVGSNSF